MEKLRHHGPECEALIETELPRLTLDDLPALLPTTGDAFPAWLPRVSIIVPVKNGAATIAGCIEALLAQDYPPALTEIVIVVAGATGDRLCRRAFIRVFPLRVAQRVPLPWPARVDGIRQRRPSDDRPDRGRPNRRGEPFFERRLSGRM